MTCHAFGITSIDTPYVQYENKEGLVAELDYLKKIGMKAKFAIHPLQVDPINTAFCPTDEQVEYYGSMVSEFDKAQAEEGKAAINFRGKMVDIAAYKRGLDFLKQYEQLKHLK
uniref:Uncharacterized protein n=1 Tax=Strombidium inclinatum TaxID=197538 RepID=A0A7S3IFD4_9SPIT|mmetsp:Transcript_13599/g.21266  ORF Transcript_13599/g.21266 Transcript_13599/m.21266 type:complete len:113 (+) Transcript_13599:635-973(+)